MVDMILAMQIGCMHWIQRNHLEKEYLRFMSENKISCPYVLIEFVITYLESHSDKVIESDDLQLYIDELDAF